MTKYVVDLPDNVSFIVGKGYVLFNEKEFLRIPVKQLEKYSKKEYVEVEKDEEIVYDVRKEEQMSEKYVVSQEFVNELKEWKDTLDSNDYEYKPLVGWVNLKNLPETVSMWWGDDEVPDGENNNRLIAILCWVNGEDVFEVEKPKKWIVRSKEVGNNNRHSYVRLVISSAELTNASVEFDYDWATYFDTREEAESWANAHQEVIQVEVD